MSYIEVTPRTTDVQSILSKLWPLSILFEISKERGFAFLVVCSNASHPVQTEKTENVFQRHSRTFLHVLTSWNVNPLFITTPL